MKTKRVVALALVIAIIASFGVMLSACDNTFSINWNNYLLDSAEFTDKTIFNNSLPTSVSAISIPSDAIAVNTEYASKGLLVLYNGSRYYGYLIASGTTFGKNDDLISLYADTTGYVYIAKEANNTILYDTDGNVMLEIKTDSTTPLLISTSVVTSEVDGKTTRFLKISSAYQNQISPPSVMYREIRKDGTLGVFLDELPKTEQSLPQVGENFSKATVTLGEWLPVNTVSFVDSDIVDTTLTDINVQQLGNTAIFYNKKGTQISTFAKPIYVNAVAYANGKILYTTLTPVDSTATSGFNFINGSSKYNNKMFSFDVKSGKTKELSVDYIMMPDNVVTILNNKKGKYDLASMSAYRMIDGIAYKNTENADTLVINDKGAIGYSAMDNPFGMPFCKIGKNYLTISYGSSFYDMTYSIVNSKGQLKATLGNTAPRAILADRLVVTIGGKVGAVGFDGIVKTDFKYSLVGSVYNNYAHVTNDDNEDLIVDFNAEKAQTIDEICKVSNYEGLYFSGYFIRVETSSSTYNWYMLDGTKVAEKVIDQTMYPSTFTRNDKKYGFVNVTTTNGETQYLKFEF